MPSLHFHCTVALVSKNRLPGGQIRPKAAATDAGGSGRIAGQTTNGVGKHLQPYITKCPYWYPGFSHSCFSETTNRRSGF